jgi:hypothetical protein
VIVLFIVFSPGFGSPIWICAFIVTAPHAGVVTADTRSNLPLAGTSPFLGVRKPIVLLPARACHGLAGQHAAE